MPSLPRSPNPAAATCITAALILISLYNNTLHMLRLGARCAPAPTTAAACLWQSLQPRHAYSIEGKVNADPDEVAELIESTIVRPSKAEREQQSPLKLLTTRREALSLYREVLRYSNLFVWKDEHGRVWKDVIRASARQEFEQARHEPDPELINRMIVTGREAVQRTVEGFMKRRAKIIDEEDRNPQAPRM